MDEWKINLLKKNIWSKWYVLMSAEIKKTTNNLIRQLTT